MFAAYKDLREITQRHWYVEIRKKIKSIIYWVKSGRKYCSEHATVQIWFTDQ